MHYDVIIIGVGSMGSSAAYYLAKEGKKVLGLEQFEIVNERGSHHGQSRIIRKAYFEHPDYVPLLLHAYKNWKELEQATKSKIYEETGIAYFGQEFDELIAGVQQSAALYDLDLQRLNVQEGKNKFPAFNIPSDFIVLSEPEAGFVLSEKAIQLYADEARKSGAVLHSHTEVSAWKIDNNQVHVSSSKGDFTADKLIITAGAWTKKLVPDLMPEITVTKQTVAWVKPKKQEKFALGNFPCWLIQDPDKGPFYGFPILPKKDYGGFEALKIAHHFPGEITDADKNDQEVNEETVQDIRYILEKYFDEADAEILQTSNCLYASTRDEDFIVDLLPGFQNKVIIGCGFSGHGFKFASVMGEILRDLCLHGDTTLPIHFLRLDRFD
ncbi:MAG TPA: N-methyl-L-tryptophan oxidase [Cyclobacteriaceae bacterium]|nr:N-methyl-L-tryptophan oxidase [Cyclobacteriaceae bacterium]